MLLLAVGTARLKQVGFLLELLFSSRKRPSLLGSLLGKKRASWRGFIPLQVFFLSKETQGLLSERMLRLELSSSSQEGKLAGFYPPPGVPPLLGDPGSRRGGFALSFPAPSRGQAGGGFIPSRCSSSPRTRTQCGSHRKLRL